jgi:hypothetical protein
VDPVLKSCPSNNTEALVCLKKYSFPLQQKDIGRRRLLAKGRGICAISRKSAPVAQAYENVRTII